MQAAILVLGVACAISAASGRDAAHWEPKIVEFETRDREAPPRPGGILFTGSSSIVMWKSLQEDMAPLRTLNRGFGGSEIAHVNHYAERIVLPYAPSAVVLYAGDNDLAAGSEKTPEQVFADFRRFVEVVRRLGPDVPVYFLAIKPSLARWDRWPLMRAANAKIEEWASGQNGVSYVDVATPMLGPDGKPRPELFIEDGLHLSDPGYRLWTRIVRPVLGADR